MNPWKTLNIEPTDDKKLIKKAYAVLVKLYKPDEQPEKFKEIQEAYHMVLEIARSNQTTFDDCADTNKDITCKIEIKDIDIEKEMMIAQSILQDIELVAHKHSDNPFNMNHWLFIKKFREIDNLDLKEETAQKVFTLVANIDINCRKENKDLLIPMKIIKYMHEIFGWEEQLKIYLTIFPLQEIEFMYSQMDPDEPAYKITLIKFEGRLKCFISDLFPSFIIAYIWMFFSEYGSFSFEFVKHVFLIYSCHHFTFEFLFKNSLGKASNDANLANINGGTVSRLQIIIKHIIINFTFFPVYAWLFDRYLNYKIFFLNEYIDYKFWLPVFGLLIVTNIITLLFSKRLLHEVITGLIVLHKQPEEKPLFE